MAENLPYMVSTGLIPKILGKITEARRPDRFTQDFLETKLGFSGGSARAVISLLKRIELLSSDGTPTELYDQFRNPDTQAYAMSKAIKIGYKELFDRNEYAYELSRDKLIGKIMEITGLEKDNRATIAMAGTFIALKEFADFETAPLEISETHESQDDQIIKEINLPNENMARQNIKPAENLGFNVAYTINLNLPETTNPDVFNAIFKSLKENLLD